MTTKNIYHDKFIKAIRDNDLDAIKTFIKFKKVKVNQQKNSFIIDAAAFGQVDIVSFLLQFDEVNLADDWNYAITLADCEDHYEAIGLLWSDLRVKKTLKKDNFDLWSRLIKSDIKDKVNSF
jgi:hypothetical protein